MTMQDAFVASGLARFRDREGEAVDVPVLVFAALEGAELADRVEGLAACPGWVRARLTARGRARLTASGGRWS